MGLDVLLKTSRMLRDNSLVPTERGQFLQLGSYLGDDMGPSLYAGGREVDRGYPKASPTSTCELCKGVIASLLATQFRHLQNEILKLGLHGYGEDKIT